MSTLSATETLRAASLLLSDLEATFEYPGFVQIPRFQTGTGFENLDAILSGDVYQFGAANDCFGYDILDGDNQVVCSEDLIGLEATPEELAEAIRETIQF